MQSINKNFIVDSRVFIQIIGYNFNFQKYFDLKKQQKTMISKIIYSQHIECLEIQRFKKYYHMVQEKII